MVTALASPVQVKTRASLTPPASSQIESAVFININLADGADGPAVDMGRVIACPERSRDNEFRIGDIINQFAASSFCQIHDCDLVSLIGIDQSHGGPLQSDLVVTQGEDSAICWQ